MSGPLFYVLPIKMFAHWRHDDMKWYVLSARNHIIALAKFHRSPFSCIQSPSCRCITILISNEIQNKMSRVIISTNRMAMRSILIMKMCCFSFAAAHFMQLEQQMRWNEIEYERWTQSRSGWTKKSHRNNPSTK